MKLLRFWRDLRILLDQNKKVENILKDNQENEDAKKSHKEPAAWIFRLKETTFCRN